MLHKNPELISAATLSLTRELQSLPELAEFYLVGGTALTLQMGHRNSIDIDLFSQNDFNADALLSLLKKKYTLEERYVAGQTIIIFLNKIKVDFIKYNYPFVNPPLSEEGIHFLSKEDIAAMKLNAIAQSGKRLKDFIDVYFLLQHFSVSAMISFFETKYPQTNTLIPLRALNYFDDIDPEMDPPKLLSPLPLSEIKNRIRTAILHPYKVFGNKS